VDGAIGTWRTPRNEKHSAAFLDLLRDLDGASREEGY
jgi:hypothetical protein